MTIYTLSDGVLVSTDNDCYVYWRCYVISAFVCFSYVVLYQLNYFFNLGLPVQFVHDYDPVRNFSYSYSLMSIPLTLFIMGYGLLSLIANLDLKTFDLTWMKAEDTREYQEKRKKFFGVRDINHPEMIRFRCCLVLIALSSWGWGSTIVLSYYEDLAYSSVYQILIGFVLSGTSVMLCPLLPLLAAHYYQSRKGWLPPVVNNI